MAGNSNQKIKLLYLLDILKKYSDEQNPLTTNEILDYLKKYDVESERKSIYSDIEVLRQFGMDIIDTRVPKRGYYLAEREFEVPEIYLLTDAVQAAGFITPKKSKELVKKLEGMLSENSAKAIQQHVFINNRSKCDNEEIYYNIDSLIRAILSKKKVSLKYQKHVIIDNKISTEYKDFKISPYALAWANDHYYLVGNNEKYDNLMHIRIDRMRKVTVTDEDYRHFSEVCEYKNSFDVADYSKKSINMFGGEPCDIQLICAQKLLDQIIDKFGDDIYIRNEPDNKHFFISTKAFDSDGLIGWLLQFGEDIKVVSPPSLQEKILKKINNLIEIYK